MSSLAYLPMGMSLEGDFNHSTVASTESGLLSITIVLWTSLSLVGLVFTFITYSLFSDLRTLSGTTLLNFLGVIFLIHVVSMLGTSEFQFSDERVYVLLSFLLHFLRLVSFFWLTAMAHDIYSSYRTTVSMIHSQEQTMGTVYWKYTLFAWGTPIIFLGAAIVLELRQGLLYQLGKHHEDWWLLSWTPLLYSFVIPVALIIIIDIYYITHAFLASKYVISMQLERKAQKKLQKRRDTQLLVHTKLLLVLTLVAGCACVGRLTNNHYLWAVYMIANAVQGSLFTVCLVCNCQALNVYSKSFRKVKSAKHSYGLDSDKKSTSLQLLTWDPYTDCV